VFCYGYFRRNHSVPEPQAADIKVLNQQLLKACQQDEHRLITGHEQKVGAALLIEREALLPLAPEGMDLAHTAFPFILATTPVRSGQTVLIS
jgi:hypothetical protein